MKKETYFTKILLESIEDILETLGFYVGNNDGEYSEKDYLKIVEEVRYAVLVDFPDNLFNYIRDYMAKNYPFNIDKKYIGIIK